MKTLIIPSLLICLAACGKSGSKTKVETSTPDSKVSEVSGADVAGDATKVTDGSATVKDSTDAVVPAITPPADAGATEIDTSKTSAINVRFNAKVGSEDLRCSKTQEDVNAGQIFSDIRIFITNLSFVDDKGQEIRLNSDVSLNSSNLQYVDSKSNSLALLNFLPADCAESDATAVVKTAITGLLPHGVYKEIRFQVGLPYAAMSPELTAIPSALAPSDMGWMWEHYPADVQIELNKGAQGKRVLNALTSSKKRTNVLALNYKLTDGSAQNVDLNLDFAKLFEGDALSFVTGLENACNNSTKAPSETTAPRCAQAFKALGLEISNPAATYEQSVFSVVSELK